jgi:hypothetical protein
MSYRTTHHRQIELAGMLAVIACLWLVQIARIARVILQ